MSSEQRFTLPFLWHLCLKFFLYLNLEIVHTMVALKMAYKAPNVITLSKGDLSLPISVFVFCCFCASEVPVYEEYFLQWIILWLKVMKYFKIC